MLANKPKDDAITLKRYNDIAWAKLRYLTVT